MTVSPWDQPPGPYAGIGSRRAPRDVLDLSMRIGEALARRGFSLRSGAAEGEDTAFEVGAIRGGGRMGIWLPWPGFDQRRLGWAAGMGWRETLEQAATLPRTRRRLFERPTAEAMQIAARTHPRWATMKRSTQALQSRNSHQVLGHDCKTPSLFAVLWTEDGATLAEETTDATGGTGQAIRVCGLYGIPVHNLAREDHRRMWEGFVKYC